MIENILICVVLPIAIVLITSLSRIFRDNKRSQIIIKAIEADRNIDTDKLLEAFQKPKKSDFQILNGRLLYGCIYSLVGIALIISGTVCDTDPDASLALNIFGGISTALGISYLIVYFITRKQVNTRQPD